MKRRSWLPDTLFGRNVLLIVGLIVAAQLGVSTAFFLSVQWPRIAATTRYAIQHVEAMRRALEPMDRAQADQYIAAINATGPTEILRDAQPPGNNERPRELALRLFGRSIAAQLPAGYVARWQQQPQRRLWLGTEVHGETVWFGLAAGMLVTDPSTVLIAVVGAAGLLAFAGAYLIQRRINRPLQQLIDATGQIATGLAPQPLPEQAPHEIAALARSFNVMVESLARADRDRALMLAGISHDLRTPLTKLRFALEYVGPHCEPEMRTLMERNIEAADRIIDQFIDFARYGGDERAQVVDLNALATEVVKSFDAVREPIALEIGTLPLLSLRPTAMQRLIFNLLRNALDYARAGVVLRTQQTADGFVIAVLDRGPGIPADDIERLKRPFTRIEVARSGPGGSGLGLAIVERVTQLHGGRFELLPREGGGLEARVSLPRAVRHL
ncbi:MAG TPA: ATP-binding protein [Burkholderiaceae bacterium]|nr:ATP-binding protein [Burkholderiaceae bacterium]